MKRTLVTLAVAALLGACGGSDDGGTAASDPTVPDPSDPLDPSSPDGASAGAPGPSASGPDGTPVADAPSGATADPGTGAASGTGTVSPAVVPDGAPRALAAVIRSDTAATITWQAPTEAPADRPYAYEVRRDGAIVRPFRGFAVDDASSTTYVDDFLVGGRDYVYEVVAIANDDADFGEETRSPAASITLRTPGGYVPAADGSPPALDADNHVERLRYAFDVLNGSADGYGHDILSLPGYSDPRVAAPPAGREDDPVVTESASCTNGGTAEFAPYIFGYREVTYGWSYAFDDCQDGARVLDGDFFRSDSSRATARSEDGFTVDEQTRRLEFSGELQWAYSGSRAADSRFWNLGGVDYTVTEGDRAVFELRAASAGLYTVFPVQNSMSGSFRVRSDATDGQMLRVNVIETLRYDFHDIGAEGFTPPRFTDGVIEIAGEDGSTVTLDAGTGDLDTVEITLRAGDAVATFTESWSLWEDSIQCFPESTYGAEPLRGCLSPEG